MTIKYTGQAVLALPVSNLDKARGWYLRVLGLREIRLLDTPPWCELETHVPGLTLGLAEVDPVRTGDAALTLEVEDLDLVHTKLCEAGEDISEITDKAALPRICTLLDPDGNAILLREKASSM